jgi:ketosteroid isomerase-like protein
MDKTTSDITWRARIEALQDESRVAFLAGDRVALDRLWADEMVVNSPVGRVLNKATVLDLLQNGLIRHIAYDERIEAIVRHGDTVVVMGGDTVVDIPDGPRIERRFTQVWRAFGADWRLVARHAHGMPRH